MSDQTKGLAALLAAHGRNGDTELIHATKGEVAALNRLKHGLSGSGLPRNPHTGLHEANFFNQWVVPALPAAAGIAAGALTGGTMAVPAATLAGAVTGGATKAIQGGSGSDIALGTGLGAISGYGGGTLGAGLAEAGGSAAAGAVPPVTPPVTPPVDAGVGGANAFTGNATIPGANQAFGTFGGATPNASNAFVTGMQDGAQAFNAGTPASTLPPTGVAQTTATSPQMSMAQGTVQGDKFIANAAAPQPQMSLAQGSVQGDKFVANPNAPVNTQPPKYASKMDFLKSDEAAGTVPKLAIGTLGLASLNQGNLNTSGVTGETVDKSLPETEVYYTSTGERRTRAVDRPRYGNVNMARGGDVYGDYDGVEEAADGGYIPGGGLNYANGGVARFGGGGFMNTGWGEQNRGGFSGLTESLQPGGALGAWHGKLYGALGADQVMPGGAMGSLIPGANQYNAQKSAAEEKKRKEEAEGIAAAAKAKQVADQKAAFESQWSDRYGAPVQMAASGGVMRFNGSGASDIDVADLEHPAARYLRRAEAGGSPIVDKNVRGAAGRVGYNFPVGDTGNFNAGVSGYGMRAHAPGTDPVTRGQLTGVDLAYSPSQDRTISARYDAMAPASMPSYGGGYSAADFDGRPNMLAMGEAPIARDRFSVNYRQSFNEGGISALGHYSDGGQMLRGPGDGVSDSIPASIEGKRPARLADGEFVIPARAVSELGNGSTEAGSKQLYAMLDRIAKKRKKGSGLAYQANPKKLMPV